VRAERVLAAALLVPLAIAPLAAHAELVAHTDDRVYVPGQPLLVYGTASPGEGVIVRLFAPDGSIARFDQAAPEEDGAFTHVLLTWPQAAPEMPYGTYTLEAISAGESVAADVTFAAEAAIAESASQRRITTTVFAPQTAAVGSTQRIFVQVESDGLLVAGDPAEILGSTHVHLPDGSAEPLAARFRALHQGLYYADHEPSSLGTHVYHAVAFHQGTASHGSAVTTVLGGDIGAVTDRLAELDALLARTSDELARLSSEVGAFGSALEGAAGRVDESTGAMRESVTAIEGASVQLNALFFPIVGLVAFIVALQIAILARWR